MEDLMENEVMTGLNESGDPIQFGEMRPSLIKVIHDDKEEAFYLVHGTILKSLIEGLAQLDRKMIPVTSMKMMYGYLEKGRKWKTYSIGTLNDNYVIYSSEVDGPKLCLSRVFLVNAGEVYYRQSNTFDKIFILEHTDLTYTEDEAKEALYESIKQKVKNYEVI